jgi:hypothetical protein
MIQYALLCVFAALVGLYGSKLANRKVQLPPPARIVMAVAMLGLIVFFVILFTSGSGWGWPTSRSRLLLVLSGVAGFGLSLGFIVFARLVSSKWDTTTAFLFVGTDIVLAVASDRYAVSILQIVFLVANVCLIMLWVNRTSVRPLNQ